MAPAEPAPTEPIVAPTPTVNIARFIGRIAEVGFHEALANSVNGRINTLLIATQGYTVVFDDVEPDEEPTGIWIRATLLDGDSQQVEIGKVDAVRDRTTGLIVFQVFGPADEGDGNIRAVCDIVKTAFKRTSEGGVVYKTPSVTRAGRRGNEVQFNVSCPFYADSVG